jgi:hypothetical protein
MMNEGKIKEKREKRTNIPKEGKEGDDLQE